MDEASNLCWALNLVARWEGAGVSITIIEKHLWPLLLKWSSGGGTSVGAASAITCIGISFFK